MKYRFLAFPEGKQKCVTFSYDDAVIQDLKLAQLFCDYGVKGTFNVNSTLLGQKGNNSDFLTPEAFKAGVIDKGHEVACHGAMHIASGACDKTTALRDAFFGRRDIEEMFDMIIRGMAYPDSGITQFNNGNDYQSVKNILTYSGIVYSRTLGGDNNRFDLPTDFHAWMPTAHHDNPKLFEWIDEFNAIKYHESIEKRNSPRLMYIWGHSYEFDKRNNWDRMEEILKKLSGREDTWYATNIEIYDYVKAYESLHFSVDGARVFNPSGKTVWFTENCKIYKIEPNESLKID